jgi:hypothetical protein
MSANFKGRQNASLISEEPVFDAETGAHQFDQTFAGSKGIIFALARGFKEDGISYRVSNNGPIYSITARVPQNDPVLENPDRYEIYTESEDLSIFKLPVVVQSAEEWDTGPGVLLSSFRKLAEDAADDNTGYSLASGSISAGTQNTFQAVIRHLRAGVTGYEENNIVLSRFRQIDQSFANAGGKFNLKAGRLVYTTAQLNLPSDVAFSLSDLPSGQSGLPEDYRWGWRLRAQRVEKTGSMTEQTIQLSFAAWSTLAYDDATSNLNW